MDYLFDKHKELEFKLTKLEKLKQSTQTQATEETEGTGLKTNEIKLIILKKIIQRTPVLLSTY